MIPENTYTEKHHIIPKYLGGTNDEKNLIILTYRQHILAHLLLYRKYNNYQDLMAYKLMTSLPFERKRLISKLIGLNNIQTGHIQRLGKHNKDTNFINSIKTSESLRKGGLKAGKIAKETGQIYKIRTLESCRNGGIVAGNLAKEKNQIQTLAKYKGIYVLIMPDGTEFQHAFQAEEYMKINKKIIIFRCRQNNLGYSRRLKTIDELNNRWTNIK